jgi:hypothetical protein
LRQYFDAAGQMFEASITVHPADRFAATMKLQRSAPDGGCPDTCQLVSKLGKRQLPHSMNMYSMALVEHQVAYWATHYRMTNSPF